MVRPARKSDRNAVRLLWSALMDGQGAIDDRYAPSVDAEERWENDFPQWLQAEARRLLVAVDDETVCGFATAERWGPPPIYRERPGVYIDELFVHPAYRRRGHGRALVEALRKWGDEIGAVEVRAGVLAGNAQACAFWEGLGAAEIAKTFAITLDRAEEARSRSRAGIGFRM